MVILLSVGLTYRLSGRALAPLRHFASRMESIQAQNLSQPVAIPSVGDEIAQLARSFNLMLSRLDQAFVVQRQFSANAAHELRTPLAVIQTRLDLLRHQAPLTLQDYQEGLDMVATQTERLSLLVGELLEMTQLETVQRADSVSLPELFDEILCDLAEVAAARNVELEQLPSEGTLIGNDTLLYRMVYNLVENGIKYNRSGGRVTVQSLRVSEHLEITVSDTGYGIPEEFQQRVFEPFFRIDKSRSRQMGGSGLGLALVHLIVDRHGGSVKVASSSSSGTVIRVVL